MWDIEGICRVQVRLGKSVLFLDCKAPKGSRVQTFQNQRRCCLELWNSRNPKQTLNPKLVGSASANAAAIS